MLKNPLPWAIGLGCLTAATGFELWLPARNTVGMLADGASPVALFTIGAVLARPQKAAATGSPGGGFGDVPLVVFYKLVVHPALVLGIGKLAQAIGVPLDGFSLTVLVLIAALPSASSIPMLAERFGADAGRIARIVLFATAASFVSFSAAVAWLV
jgi:predicted permease